LEIEFSQNFLIFNSTLDKVGQVYIFCAIFLIVSKFSSMSSSRSNDSDYDSMEPLHNSTRRPASRRGRATRNNTTMSTSRNQKQKAPSMSNDEMVCICFKAPQVMMNRMASSNQDCNCTCDMGNDYMDISGIEMMDQDRTYDVSRSNRSSRREKSTVRREKSTLEELEETMANMQNDFEETILEVEDDPSNVTPLGRFYRVNSFR